MSYKTGLVKKHQDVLEKLASETNMRCYGSDNEMYQAGEFPCLGLFMAEASINLESRSYVELEYLFLFGVFEEYDRDDPLSQKAIQYSTYETLVDVINKMKFEIASNPETMTGLAFSNGSFVSGWTVFVKYNA